jgi:polar amino acid transport system substrate-binding protein
MDFGSLVAAAATRKADVILSSIFITPEREERIDFSDPYYTIFTVVAGLKTNIAAYTTEAADAAGPPGFLQRIANSFQANLVKEGRYRLILDGLRTTVLIALLATVLGTVLGAVICFMRMSSRAVLRVPATLYIAVLRGTPVLVVLMLVFYVVFASVDISPVLVAVIAFGMNFAAYAAEIFRSGIEGVDKGQSEAGLAMGFTPLQTFGYIVLPQTVRRILPVYKGEFISLVKMTSVVGYIAVQDLTKASDIIRSRTFDAFFPLVMVALLYFAISWILIQALDQLERRLDPKARRSREARA